MWFVLTRPTERDTTPGLASGAAGVDDFAGCGRLVPFPILQIRRVHRKSVDQARRQRVNARTCSKGPIDLVLERTFRERLL